jgi:hypothetical protein
MPKLLEVTEGTETKKCQANIRRTCILAVPMTKKMGLTKVGNQAQPLNYSKKLFLTN